MSSSLANRDRSEFTYNKNVHITKDIRRHHLLLGNALSHLNMDPCLGVPVISFPDRRALLSAQFSALQPQLLPLIEFFRRYTEEATSPKRFHSTKRSLGHRTLLPHKVLAVSISLSEKRSLGTGPSQSSLFECI